MSPEDDPNHRLQQLIAKRGERKTPQTQTKTETKADKEPETPPARSSPEFMGVIGKVLKFGDKKPEKKPETPPKADVDPAATPAPAPEPAKSIVSKRKAGAPAPDTAKIAAEAAAAATREAIAATTAAAPAKVPSENIEDSLHESDLHEYEVAKFLAKSNPRYKEAPKIILGNIERTEAYADKWESENPGKIYNPKDEAHNEFYDGLPKAWTDDEFQDAVVEMKVAKVLAEREKAEEPRLRKEKVENAKQALQPVVDRAYTSVAAQLARQVDEAAHAAIIKDGFDKFEEADPITAYALASTVAALRPLIETAVQIDDPQARVPFDEHDPSHKQWLDFLLEKEAQFQGVEYEGKMFASRPEYARMTQAQRKRHWYLTLDLLVSEMVNDATAEAKAGIAVERERQKKIAAAMGYVPKEQSNGDPTKPAAPKSAPVPRATVPAPEPSKPVSPSASRGSASDNPGGVSPKGNSGLQEQLAKILFAK